MPAPATLAAFSLDAVLRVATLQQYNTRLVVLSTTLLGVAAGLVGGFLLLRKRSLMGDALSHATLPGIGLAFLVMVGLGGTGKALPGLLAGAVVTGGLGVLVVLAIRHSTRLKEDAAMGIVLSVFFGLGVAVLRSAQETPGVGAAGLDSFLYGKTASMIRQDFLLIAGAAAAVTVVGLLLFKEFTLVCFDDAFARAQGWPVVGLDVAMLTLAAVVTVVGLQAVGLILVIAFLITPPAAARFWTHDLRAMVLLSAGLGGLSGWLGASLSALTPGLPAGAVIVLTAAALFVVSMLFGPPRGVVMRLVRRARLKRKVGRQNLLRAAFELLETHRPAYAATGETPNTSVAFADLLHHRSWARRELLGLVRTALREDHVERFDGRRLLLSEAGYAEAARATRNHRLWETYLITHADVAPSHVDRDADMVEHVLGVDMVRQLEQELRRRSNTLPLPASPHVLPGGGDAPTPTPPAPA